MSDRLIVKVDEVPVIARGNGIETTLLVGHERCGAKVTSGITSFPPNTDVPIHSHNCDEQVVILEGEAEVEIEGERTRLKPNDTVYVAAGRWHRFVNTGSDRLRILWIYDSSEVTRTFKGSGKTVGHLSGGDVVTQP
jgi:mannose-6-phosphate isomerase-like protein (cupin superfamily)